jgi:uncharacterized membrane protein
VKHASIRWWIDIFLLHACVFTDLLVFGILVETESKCFPPLLLVMEEYGIFVLLFVIFYRKGKKRKEKLLLIILFISILMMFTDFGICREHEFLQMPALW